MIVRIGTSGFAYDEWKGSFYPEKIAAKDMLKYYAERLPVVEINNTFYRLPKEEVLKGWADQVPDGFTFVVKASQRITHFSRLKECGELLAYLFRVTGALGPKLGPVLFQLPPNFKKDVPRLAAFFDAMPDRRRVAFEFRHASWFDDETFDLLRRQSAALCVSDTGEEFTDAQLVEWARKILAQPWQDAFVFLIHEEEGKGPKLAAKLIELCGASAVRAGR